MASPRAGEPVAFIMALSPEEFRATASILARTELPAGAREVTMPAGAHPAHGSVRIEYSPLPGVTLGGLLSLPRAHVVLAFDGADAATRAAFVERFARTFQRGGG